MVFSFERKMELYRQQIEELESHLSATVADTSVSPQSTHVHKSADKNTAIIIIMCLNTLLLV